MIRRMRTTPRSRNGWALLTGGTTPEPPEPTDEGTALVDESGAVLIDENGAVLTDEAV